MAKHPCCPVPESGLSVPHLRKLRRRGTSAVEFALTAPVLFLLFFGFVDVGRAIMVKNLLTSAARDGARSASLDGSTTASVEAQVNQFLEDSSVHGATVTVSPNPLTSASVGAPVSVTAQVPFSSVSWLPSSFYLDGVTLDATVIMRRETTSSTSSGI